MSNISKEERARRAAEGGAPLVQAGFLTVDTASNPDAVSDDERAERLDAANRQTAADAEAAVKAIEESRKAAEKAQTDAAKAIELSPELEKLIAERIAEAIKTSAESGVAASQVVTEEYARAGVPQYYMGGPQVFQHTTEVIRTSEQAPHGTITEVYEGSKRVGVVLANGEVPPAATVVDL